MFKLYPDRPLGAIFRLTCDLAVAAWMVFWGLAGFLTYQTVMQLELIADGLRDTGRTFNDWIHAFQVAVPGGIPLLTNYLRAQAADLQRHTGDPLIRLSADLRVEIFQAAIVLGFLVALPPIVYALGTYGVWRWRDMREMGAALAFVRVAQLSGRVEEARALLAYRAVSQLSFTALMRASRDPVSDLAARRYDDLAGAMLERAGLDRARLARTLPPSRQLSAPDQTDAAF